MLGSHFLINLLLLVLEFFSVSSSEILTARRPRNTIKYFKSYKNLFELDRVSKYEPKPLRKYSALSPKSIQALAALEREIYSKLKAVFETYSSNANHSNRFLSGYFDELECANLLTPKRQESTDRRNVKSDNIISVYLMIRRFMNHIRPLIMQGRQPETGTSVISERSSVSEYLRSVFNKTEGPYKNDLHIAMAAIIITQYKLDLKTIDLANGQLDGTVTNVTLKAIHCLEIGVHAITLRIYAIGIEWIELTLSKIQGGDVSANSTFAARHLKRAESLHDDSWNRVDDTSTTLVRMFFNKRLQESNGSSERRWLKHEMLDEMNQEFSPIHLNDFELCKPRSAKQTEIENPKFYCWLETEVHPTWKIGPLKAELHSAFPYLEIVRFHDLIRKSITEEIKAIAELSSTALTSKGSIVDPKTRLAATSEFGAHFLEKELTALSERVTGLKAGKYCKAFRLGLYAPGGHEWYHMDADPVDNATGYLSHTIASLLYYLDDTNQGGQTAFPMVGVATDSIRGSATLWYNLYSSSDLDLLSAHGPCPLVQGEKSIAIKWFSYHDQHHLKCDLNPRARVETLVNGNSKYKWTYS